MEGCTLSIHAKAIICIRSLWDGWISCEYFFVCALLNNTKRYRGSHTWALGPPWTRCLLLKAAIVVLPYDCLAHVDLACLDCNPVYGRIRTIFATKPRVVVILCGVRAEDGQGCVVSAPIVSAGFGLNFVSGLPINEISASLASYAVVGDFSTWSSFTSLKFYIGILQKKYLGLTPKFNSV